LSVKSNNESQRSRLQDAIRSIRRLQNRVAELEGAAHEPIAIVGMGCRLPGDVASPDAYWQLLENGVDAITEVPPERWDGPAHYDPDPETPGKMYTLAGGFVRDIDRFDAGLFGLSPREVAKIDPQHRLVLEVAWEALEHAGLPPKGLSESATGVYLGITAFDYGLHLSHMGDANIDAYSMTGTKLNFAAGRLSYLLGLQGPAMSVDTACSSSLVAIHLASQALRRGECDLALAGGVNAMLTPEQTVAECKARMLSPNGLCRTFDARADGFVRGEGCGMLVLERLSTAQQKGHAILAVIRGSAVNQDGPTSGPTVPNRIAQEAVIRSALDDAGVGADDIDYVEAHGTATPLGDPIEVRALANVFGGTSGRRAPLKIGSVKTNFGHLESAAGIAGLMKAVLGLQHEVIPPHLHVETLTPAVDWESIPIEVVTAGEPWLATQQPRRAGVSSFGASGTNAHIVVEDWRTEAVTDVVANEERPLHAYCLSAVTANSLRALATVHAQALANMNPDELANACHTVAAGRSHFPQRIAVIGAGVQDISEGLNAFADGMQSPAVFTGRNVRAPRVGFLLPGRLGESSEAGRELYESQAIFRERIDECADLLDTRLERPLPDVLFGDTAAGRRRPSHAEPALLALQYALAGVWKSWGVTPSAVLGRGTGEYTAACLAGALSFADALTLAHARGLLIEAMSDQGAMAAVGASVEQVAEAIAHHPGVSIAAVNGPEAVVISGDSGEIDDVSHELQHQNLRTHILETGCALQSALVEPLLDEFTSVAGDVAATKPRIRVFSCVTGTAVPGQEALNIDYWKRQLRDVVRFDDAVLSLANEDFDTFVEIGPDASLTQMARVSLSGKRATCVNSLEHGRSDWQPMVRALGKLYASGCALNWEAVNRGYASGKLRLPTYAFDRKRHWIDMPPVTTSGLSRVGSTGVETGHPLLGCRLRSPLQTVQFTSVLGLDRQRWLQDHKVFGRILVPATAYFEVLLAAANRTAGSNAELEDIFIHAPIIIEADGETVVHTVVEPTADAWRIKVLTPLHESATDDGWAEHVSATVRRSGDNVGDAQATRLVDIENIAARCSEDLDIDEHYQAMRETGVEFGPAFHTVTRIRRGDQESIGWVTAPEDIEQDDNTAFWMHPAVLDGCLQVAREALPESVRDEREAAHVPMGLGRLVTHGVPKAQVVCHASLKESGSHAGTFELDLTIMDDQGRCYAELQGLRLARIDRNVLDAAAGRQHRGDIYQLAWQGRPVNTQLVQGRAPGNWLLFDLGDPMLAGCADALVAAGEQVWTVTIGDGLQVSNNGCTVRIDKPADFRRLVEATVGNVEGPWTIVHAGGSLLPDTDFSAAALQQLQAVHMRSLLQLTQALESSAASVARLIIVTNSTQGASSTANLAGAPLWGLGRVIQTEFSRLHTVLLDSCDAKLVSQQILAESLADDAENQIHYRDGERYVARLAPLGAGIAAANHNGTYRLALQTPGIPDSLALQPMQRRSPGRGEIEIEVASAGLNFRDVLVALGVYQGPAGPLGGECAGRVVSVGDDVDDFNIGDEVIAFVEGAMASHAIADARLTWRKPTQSSFEQAATLPIAFLTATYCLHELGCMKRGDRVLIHGAAGGVGMAAVQLARRAGAEIFGTAGTPDKRELIESLGVDHTLDSRSLDFADRIMELTDGQGVDLVLNSLAGEFIPQSLRVTRNGGRFVEIGRTDIWTAEQVRELRPEIEYHTVLLGDVSESDPELIGRLGANIVADIDAGNLVALPLQSWPMGDAATAFRLMAHAGHTGKIVLANDRFGEDGGLESSMVQADGAYLVSGGFGGLGLEVARWLADQGAAMIALLGRHEPDEVASAAIQQMRDRGVTVLPVVGDVTCSADVRNALDLIAQDESILRGVVHAAGTLDDGILAEQDWERIEGVLSAKVAGAWTLHELTENQPLDFFVLFSSASALFGAAGQGGYAAGNAFLDSLARWRRGRGQPALSINWGPWADVGMFAKSGEAGIRAVTERGFQPLTAERNFAALSTLLTTDLADAGVFAADWAAYNSMWQGSGKLPLIADLIGSSAAPAEFAPDYGVFAEELRSAPVARRSRLMSKRLREEVAFVLNSTPDSVQTKQGFRELGMDSLMSVELRNRLERLLGCSLVSTVAFDHPNVEQLGEFLLDQTIGRTGEADQGVPAVQAIPAKLVDDINASVADLSDEEAEQQLVEELSKIREAEQNG
jgi:acyl transferase domain-containing protein/acyl carrier protein